MICWEQIKTGDERAFTNLYNDHADFLFAFGMKIIPDDNLIYECIQDLYIYLYEAKERLSEPVSVRAYLCTALKRIIMKAIYHNKKRKTLSLDDAQVESYRFELEIDIEAALIHTEMQEDELKRLQLALDELSPQQREVIYLKYYKNCSNDEVSEILGVSNQIVRNVSSRALIKLREFGNIRTLMLLVTV